MNHIVYPCTHSKWWTPEVLHVFPSTNCEASWVGVLLHSCGWCVICVPHFTSQPLFFLEIFGFLHPPTQQGPSNRSQGDLWRKGFMSANRRALKGTPQPNVILETTGMSPTSMKHHWSLSNHDIFWGTNGLVRYASPHCRESTTKRLSFLQNGALIESLPLVVRSNMECIPQKTVSNDFPIWNSMSCIPCFNLQSVAFIDVPCTIADQESHQFRNQNTHLLWWHTPSERHQGAVKISTKKLINTNANKIAFNMPKSYKCILTHVQFWQKELLDVVATMRSGQLFKFEWRV